jgi:peptidoglycan/xylan/chitin deacetylase (PgdA/CDA1 family)
MLFRKFIALGALFFLVGQAIHAQETKPAIPVEKTGVTPVKPKPSPSPTEPPITINSVHVDGPFIALTFDDGPHGSLTPKLLDLLAKHRLKATFFVVGQCVVEYPDIVKRAAREGHEIASHSWSHPNLGKMSDDAVRRELQKTDDAIVAAIGKRPTLLRPPYGSITARQKHWIHQEFGYRIIIWDVDPLDWKRPGPSVVTARILKETKAGSIVLAHDIHAPTLEAMPATFDQLVKKGFKSVTVTELLGMATPIPPKPTPTPSPASVPRAGPVASPTPSASPPITTSTP